MLNIVERSTLWLLLVWTKLWPNAINLSALISMTTDLVGLGFIFFCFLEAWALVQNVRVRTMNWTSSFGSVHLAELALSTKKFFNVLGKQPVYVIRCGLIKVFLHKFKINHPITHFYMHLFFQGTSMLCTKMLITALCWRKTGCCFSQWTETNLSAAALQIICIMNFLCNVNWHPGLKHSLEWTRPFVF